MKKKRSLETSLLVLNANSNFIIKLMQSSKIISIIKSQSINPQGG